jgi:hypothetical protein
VGVVGTDWLDSVRVVVEREAVRNSCKEAAVQVVAAAGINDAFKTTLLTCLESIASGQSRGSVFI